jgi:DNA polymerase-3 subunit beta
MNFIADRKLFKAALDSVRQAVPSKATIDSIKFVLCEVKDSTLTLTGYDLETGIITSIDVEVPMGENNNFSFLADGNKISEIISKQTADTVEISIDEASLAMTIKCGKSKCKLQTVSADNYPSTPSFDENSPITLSGETLSEMIRQTVFAVAVTDNKPVLTGECFNISGGSFDVAAIDGFRLAVRTEKIDPERTEKFVVKANALNAVAKLIKSDKNVNIYPNKKHVVFDMGDVKLFSRLLEGDFHNYKGSIPSVNTTEVIIETRPVIHALERFILLTDMKNKAPLCCEISSGKIDMSLKSPLGEMSETIDDGIGFSGNNVKIGFNCRYLLDALKATETDKVKLLLNGAVAPMTIVPLEGDSFTFLVLPVRLRNT